MNRRKSKRWRARSYRMLFNYCYILLFSTYFYRYTLDLPVYIFHSLRDCFFAKKTTVVSDDLWGQNIAYQLRKKINRYSFLFPVWALIFFKSGGVILTFYVKDSQKRSTIEAYHFVKSWNNFLDFYWHIILCSTRFWGCSVYKYIRLQIFICRYQDLSIKPVEI